MENKDIKNEVIIDGGIDKDINPERVDIGNSVADIEMITEKLKVMHISGEKVKRGYVKYLEHLHRMKEYREKNKEIIKAKRKRVEDAQPEIRRKRLKQNRDRYYKKKYGMTEDEYKGI